MSESSMTRKNSLATELFDLSPAELEKLSQHHQPGIRQHQNRTSLIG